jgi:hypothetical protein
MVGDREMKDMSAIPGGGGTKCIAHFRVCPSQQVINGVVYRVENGGFVPFQKLPPGGSPC